MKEIPELRTVGEALSSLEEPARTEALSAFAGVRRELGELLAAQDEQLKLLDENRVALAEFQAAGLVWLVNSSLLHPRGVALAIHWKDGDIDGEGSPRPGALPLGLSIVGDGSEPWCFGYDEASGAGQADPNYAAFKQAEAAREREWSPKLNPRGEAQAVFDELFPDGVSIGPDDVRDGELDSSS
ncbi:MAG TPA: hypothetical protein VG265_05770 [Gaiellaceae bacterium]|nr:hypothetical protein [Gaiellaceae bacterium]